MLRYQGSPGPSTVLGITQLNCVAQEIADLIYEGVDNHSEILNQLTIVKDIMKEINKQLGRVPDASCM